MNDFTKCGNDECSIRNKCRRWLTNTMNNRYGTYAIFICENGACEYFIDSENKLEEMKK